MRNLFRKAFFAGRSSNCQWLRGTGFKPGSFSHVALVPAISGPTKRGFLYARHSGPLEGNDNSQVIIRGDYCLLQGQKPCICQPDLF